MIKTLKYFWSLRRQLVIYDISILANQITPSVSHRSGVCRVLYLWTATRSCFPFLRLYVNQLLQLIGLYQSTRPKMINNYINTIHFVYAEFHKEAAVVAAASPKACCATQLVAFHILQIFTTSSFEYWEPLPGSRHLAARHPQVVLGLNFSPPAWHGVSLLYNLSSLCVCLGPRCGKTLCRWGPKWIYMGKKEPDLLRCANLLYCSLGYLVHSRLAFKLTNFLLPSSDLQLQRRRWMVGWWWG